ncbi:hypothetical protein Dimus_038856 [Dionaea muscipula]
MDKSVYSKIHLLMQMFRVEMKQEESLQSYVDKFHKAMRNLTNIGFEFADEMKVALLLARLSPFYSLIRDQILHSSESAYYKKVLKQLISREIVKKTIEEDFVP